MTEKSPTRIVVAGAAGRMGQALSGLALSDPDLELFGATEAPVFPGIGKDIGEILGERDTGVQLTTDLEAAAQGAHAYVDFTRPQATLSALSALKGTGVKAVVIGTTGFTQDELLALQEWSQHYAIVFSGNFSLGVNMLAELVRRAARSLGPEWDIEVLETHHRHKVMRLPERRFCWVRRRLTGAVRRSMTCVCRLMTASPASDLKARSDFPCVVPAA